MKEPLDVQRATLIGSLILAIATVLVALYALWWFRQLSPQKHPIPYGEAIIGGSTVIDTLDYLMPTVDTAMALRDTPAKPHCLYSMYRANGQGLAVEWELTALGQWREVTERWSCQ